MKSLRALTLALTAMSSSSVAVAHEHHSFLGNPIVWASRSMTLRASGESFPEGNSRDALTEVAQRQRSVHL